MSIVVQTQKSPLGSDSKTFWGLLTLLLRNFTGGRRGTLPGCPDGLTVQTA